MADELAKRRAARRRKILENSEERLRKLMCKDTDSSLDTNGPVEPVHTFIEDSVIEEELYSAGSNTEDIKSSLTFENSNRPCTFKSKLKDNLANYTKDDLEVNQVLYNDDERDTSPKTPEFARCSPNNYQFPKILSENRTIHRPRRESLRNSTQLGPSSQWISFGAVRILLCIFFGIFIRTLIYAEIDFSISKSIFFPFAVLEIGLLSYEYLYVPSKANSQSILGGALTGALMLCGIQQTTLVLTASVLAGSKRIFEDSVIYLFAFLMLHWFLDISECEV